MEPGKFPYQALCQLDTVRVNFGSATVNSTAPGNNVQVAAGCLGKKNRTVIILDLLKAACAALIAERFPLLRVTSDFIHNYRRSNL